MGRRITPVEEIHPIIRQLWAGFVTRKFDELDHPTLTLTPPKGVSKTYADSMPAFSPDGQQGDRP